MKKCIFQNVSLTKHLKTISVNSFDNKPQTTRKTNYVYVNPTPVKNPSFLSISSEACKMFGLSINDVNNDESLEVISGNAQVPDFPAISHCYCGHQFGNFAGQLGDGRAIVITMTNDVDGDMMEVQLKGAGLTPYSRFADGRAVLRSSVREYLCSEFAYQLGIPTSRALSIVTSSDSVVRDVMYDGNPESEIISIVSRILPTFWRFGSFEIFKTKDKSTGLSGPSAGLEDEMQANMINYIVFNFYPAFNDLTGSVLIETLFREITVRTAETVAYWQVYGFTHGVLNTDNMSIIGATIDYGPYGFMDFFDRHYTPNHSDKFGRYSFAKLLSKKPKRDSQMESLKVSRNFRKLASKRCKSTNNRHRFRGMFRGNVLKCNERKTRSVRSTGNRPSTN